LILILRPPRRFRRLASHALGQSIIYAFNEPVAAHAYTRATYTNISEKHFM